MSLNKNFNKSQKTCKVTFALPKSVGTNAKDIRLLGEFNNWSWNDAPSLKATNDEYSVDLDLAVGRKYEYRYLIDNHKWINDSIADSYTPAPYVNIFNCVVDLTGFGKEVEAKSPKPTKIIAKKIVVKAAKPKAPKAKVEKVAKEVKPVVEAVKPVVEAVTKVTVVKEAAPVKAAAPVKVVVKKEVVKKEVAKKASVAKAAPAPKATPVVKTPTVKAAPAVKVPVVKVPVVKVPEVKVTPEVKTVEVVKEVVVTPVVKTVEVAKVVAKPAVAKKDDLTLVEGIGPKIAELLIAANISTFDALSKASVATLKGILTAAGTRYVIHDPSTWAEQGNLLATGQTEKLATLQEQLKGGKRVK